MIKRNWIIVLFLVSLSIFFISRYYDSKKASGNGSHIKLQTFQSPLGWGYDVLVNDTVLIHQPIIPGIPGNNGFKTEEQALSVGNLVISKMNKNRFFPSINFKELDSLGIKH